MKVKVVTVTSEVTDHDKIFQAFKDFVDVVTTLVDSPHLEVIQRSIHAANDDDNEGHADPGEPNRGVKDWVTAGDDTKDLTDALTRIVAGVKAYPPEVIPQGPGTEHLAFCYELSVEVQICAQLLAHAVRCVPGREAFEFVAIYHFMHLFVETKMAEVSVFYSNLRDRAAGKACPNDVCIAAERAREFECHLGRITAQEFVLRRFYRGGENFDLESVESVERCAHKVDEATNLCCLNPFHYRPKGAGAEVKVKNEPAVFIFNDSKGEATNGKGKDENEKRKARMTLAFRLLNCVEENNRSPPADDFPNLYNLLDSLDSPAIGYQLRKVLILRKAGLEKYADFCLPTSQSSKVFLNRGKQSILEFVLALFAEDLDGCKLEDVKSAENCAFKLKDEDKTAGEKVCVNPFHYRRKHLTQRITVGSTQKVKDFLSQYAEVKFATEGEATKEISKDEAAANEHFKNIKNRPILKSKRKRSHAAASAQLNQPNANGQVVVIQVPGGATAGSTPKTFADRTEELIASSEVELIPRPGVRQVVPSDPQKDEREKREARLQRSKAAEAEREVKRKATRKRKSIKSLTASENVPSPPGLLVPDKLLDSLRYTKFRRAHPHWSDDPQTLTRSALLRISTEVTPSSVQWMEWWGYYHVHDYEPKRLFLDRDQLVNNGIDPLLVGNRGLPPVFFEITVFENGVRRMTNDVSYHHLAHSRLPKYDCLGFFRI